MSASAQVATRSPGPPWQAQAAGPPARESRGRLLAIRAVAVAALGVSVAYLVWRASSTLSPEGIALSWLLWALEAHAVVGLALFTFSLWDVAAAPAVDPVDSTTLRVAVLIPTYNEPIEVLLPTVAAAVALEPVHTTWVLDDGRRAEVRYLAARLGARYLTRPDNAHAKAGNLNHALSRLDADVVAVLDADHVASPGLLSETLGYFDDPTIAVVQTPQDFYNLDSFEHDDNRSWADRRRRRERFNEQALFYRAIEPGKNRWGAAFWCGTGALVRTAALREVGGVATETVTEDIHTTIRLHRRGWRTVYHNAVLARGLAAATAEQYQAQRLRWGTGAMQVLATENPLWVRGLRMGQRVAYAATLLGWFDAWRSLGYLLVPVAVLLTGAVPIRAEPATFAAVFAVTFLLQRLALVLLARGYAPQLLSTVFELVRMPANIRATLTLLRPGRRPFAVTHKGRQDGRRRVRTPGLLRAVLALSAVAAAWFALGLAGVTGVTYADPWVAYAAAGWLVVNSALVLAAIHRIRAERFAGERRASVRFEVGVPASLDGRHCVVEDVSLTGALVRVGPASPLQPVGAPRSLRLSIGSTELELDAIVRSVRADDAGALVGLELAPGQERRQAELALAVFGERFVAELEPSTGVPREAPAPLRTAVAAATA